MRRLRAISDATAGITTMPPRWPEPVACTGYMWTFDQAMDHLERATERQRRTAEVARAKSICRGCPMKDVCKAWALEHMESRGVWGGTTPAERTTILRRTRRRG